jgi:hypothetical protein
MDARAAAAVLSMRTSAGGAREAEQGRRRPGDRRDDIAFLLRSHLWHHLMSKGLFYTLPS